MLALQDALETEFDIILYLFAVKNLQHSNHGTVNILLKFTVEFIKNKYLELKIIIN